MRSPSIIRRATASIRPNVISAVASVVTGGTTVTGIRRASLPHVDVRGRDRLCRDPAQLGLAAITSRSIRSCSRQNRMSHFFTAAISCVLAMMRLASGLTLTVRPPQAIDRALGDRLGDKDARTRHAIHRTMPATPSTATCEPSGCGAWRRARRAPSECRARAPATRGARSSRRARRPRRRRAAAHGRAPARPRGDQHVARRDARQLALAAHDHGAAGAPADAGRMAVEAGMLQPDLVRHRDRLDVSGRACKSLKPTVVERPFDLDRPADTGFALRIMRPSVTACPASRHGAPTSSRGTACAAPRRAAGLAVILAAGVDLAQEALARSTMRSGTTSPCAMAEPSPQVALISIWPSAVSLNRRPRRARRPAAG